MIFVNVFIDEKMSTEILNAADQDDNVFISDSENENVPDTTELEDDCKSCLISSEKDYCVSAH